MSNQLKELQAEWYAKLKEEGFKDIEDANNNLSAYHSTRFYHEQKRTGFSIEDMAEYYTLAQQLVYEVKFASEKEKLVWTLYAKGEIWVDIIKELKAHRVSFDYINKTVKKYNKVLVQRGKKSHE